MKGNPPIGWTDGFADLLPGLPPPEPEDDLKKHREFRNDKTVLCIMATCSRPSGEVIGPIIVTEKLPTEDFPIEKALAHMAARLSEHLLKRGDGKARHD